MEPMNALDHSYITAVIIFLLDPLIESIIRKVFGKYIFFNESGLLQFWACSSAPPNSEDVGCHLMLTGKPFVSTQDNEGLEDHRMRCLENDDRFVGLETRVGNWFAGRAVQTRIADHRTIHSAEAGGKGQLVLPVFYGRGAGKKLVGIIELVTIVPKESYFEDFRQICGLLQDVRNHLRSYKEENDFNEEIYMEGSWIWTRQLMEILANATSDSNSTLCECPNASYNHFCPASGEPETTYDGIDSAKHVCITLDDIHLIYKRYLVKHQPSALQYPTN